MNHKNQQDKKDKQMNKSIKTFYKVIGCAILIIALSVSLTLYRDKKIATNGSNAAGIITGTQGLEDLFEDDENQTEGSQQQEQTKPTVKKYTNGFQCYLDAIENTRNSKGYKAVTNSVGSVTILGITEYQYLKETFILSGDYHLREQIGYSSSALGKFYYRYWYSNNNAQSIRFKETKKITSNSLDASPDWSGKSQDTTITYEQLAQMDPYPYNVFNLLPTKKSEIVGSFDPTEDKNYYIVRFKIDLSTVPEKHAENIRREGNLKSVTLHSIERTYYIDKQTIMVRKIDKTDSYYLDQGLAGGLSTVNAQTVFVGVDRVYTPSEPNK